MCVCVSMCNVNIPDVSSLWAFNVIKHCSPLSYLQSQVAFKCTQCTHVTQNVMCVIAPLWNSLCASSTTTTTQHRVGTLQKQPNIATRVLQKTYTKNGNIFINWVAHVIENARRRLRPPLRHLVKSSRDPQRHKPTLQQHQQLHRNVKPSKIYWRPIDDVIFVIVVRFVIIQHAQNASNRCCLHGPCLMRALHNSHASFRRLWEYLEFILRTAVLWRYAERPSYSTPSRFVYCYGFRLNIVYWAVHWAVFECLVLICFYKWLKCIAENLSYFITEDKTNFL